MRSINEIMTGGRAVQLINQRVVELLAKEKLTAKEEELLNKMIDVVLKIRYL